MILTYCQLASKSRFDFTGNSYFPVNLLSSFILHSQKTWSLHYAFSNMLLNRPQYRVVHFNIYIFLSSKYNKFKSLDKAIYQLKHYAFQ